MERIQRQKWIKIKKNKKAKKLEKWKKNKKNKQRKIKITKKKKLKCWQPFLLAEVFAELVSEIFLIYSFRSSILGPVFLSLFTSNYPVGETG